MRSEIGDYATMLKESTVKEQSGELCFIIGRLVAMAGKVRDAFMHRTTQPIDDLGKHLHDLVEEIAFTAVKADEEMSGRPIRGRRPLLRYQSILTHLQIVDATIADLAEAARRQISDAVPFSVKAVDRTDILFTQQVMILSTLEEAVRSREARCLHAVCRSCREFDRLCAQSAAEHERRLAGGVCLPKSALLFLTILDRVKTLVHHEREICRLLVRWEGMR